MTIDEQRDHVIEIARTWLGTPYHHGGHVKKAGVSCAWFIAEAFNEALGLELKVIEYPEQWFVADTYIKEKRELYLQQLVEYGFVEINFNQIKKADLVVSRTENFLYCHAAIITQWPSLIHVVGTRGCCLVKSAYSSWFFGQHPDTLKYFTRKEWL